MAEFSLDDLDTDVGSNKEPESFSLDDLDAAAAPTPAAARPAPPVAPGGALGTDTSDPGDTYTPPSFIGAIGDRIGELAQGALSLLKPSPRSREAERAGLMERRTVQSPGSVFHGKPIADVQQRNTPAIDARGAPMTEQSVAEIRRALDTMTPEQRDRVAARQDATGAAARAYLVELDQRRSGALSGMGTTREDRTTRAISQGASPEVARNVGETGAFFGIEEPLSQAVPSEYDFAARQEYKGKHALERGAELGRTLLEKQAAGAWRWIGDTVGWDGMSEAAGARHKKAGLREEGIASGAQEGFQKNFESALASTISNLPGLVIGVATGGATVPLMAMGAQVFGDEYSEGRSKGLSYADATARAGIHGAAEMIGESFGLGPLLKGLKGATQGMSANELRKFFAESLLKEIPGEQLTTAIQFAADKFPSFGLNKNATLEDYLKAVEDTLVQTVMQSSIMAGGGMTVSAAVRAARGGTYGEMARELQRALDGVQVNPAAVDTIARASLDPAQAQIQRVLADKPAARAIYQSGALQGNANIGPDPIHVTPNYVRNEPPEPPEPDKQGTSDVPSLSGGALAEAPSGDGTRAAPIVATAPEHIEQAGALVNPEPTEAQKAAGNYQKAHVQVQGLDITIENPKGSERRGKDADGKEWAVSMPATYGYVKRTEGADGDQVDVYVGDKLDAPTVYVVDQVHAGTGKFDEHKAMLGFGSRQEAEDAYRAGFSDGKGQQRMGAVTEMTVDQFREWVRSGDTRAPLAPFMLDEPKNASTTGLREMGAGMADGMIAGMYDMLWEKVQSGDTQEAGAESTVLQVAKRIREAGGSVTRENLPEIASEVARIKSTLNGDPMQEALRALVKEKTPTPESTSPPDAATVLERIKAAANASGQTIQEVQRQFIRMRDQEGPNTALAYLDRLVRNSAIATNTVTDGRGENATSAPPAAEPTKAAMIPTRAGLMVQPLDAAGNPVGDPYRAGEKPPATESASTPAPDDSPAKQGEAEPAATEFQKGDRVVIAKSGQDASIDGRHGVVSDVTTLVMRPMFGGGAASRSTYYTVRTDAGYEAGSLDAADLRPETGAAPEVTPDVRLPDGQVRLPGHVESMIRNARNEAAGRRAKALRARTEKSKREHTYDAEQYDKRADGLQAALDAWAKAHPIEAAMRLEPAKRAPAPSNSPAPAPSGNALKDAGLVVTKGTTKNGKPVWEVTGNTRPHADLMKRLGGRWYGPKKAWSFYTGDPTVALSDALGGTKPADAETTGQKGEKPDTAETGQKGEKPDTAEPRGPATRWESYPGAQITRRAVPAAERTSQFDDAYRTTIWSANPGIGGFLSVQGSGRSIADADRQAKDAFRAEMLARARKVATPAIASGTVIESFPGEANTEVRIVKNNAGYAVGVYDLDAEQMSPTLRLYKGDGSLEQAWEYAKTLLPEQPAPAGARKQPGEEGYTLADARNDLETLRVRVARQGGYVDDRLLEKLRRQKELVQQMESEAAAPKKAERWESYEVVPSTRPGELIVREPSRAGGYQNFASFRMKDGRAVSISHYFESPQTRASTEKAIQRYVEQQSRAPQPQAPAAPMPAPKAAPPATTRLSVDDFDALVDEVQSERKAEAGDPFAALDRLLKKKQPPPDAKFSMEAPDLDPDFMAALKPALDKGLQITEANGGTLKEFVRQVLDRYDDQVVPYLKAWYRGVQEAQNAGIQQGSTGNAGPQALENASPGNVPAPEGGGNAGERTRGGSRPDAGRDGDVQGDGVRPPRGVGGEPGTASAQAGGAEPGRGADAVQPGVQRDGGSEPDAADGSGRLPGGRAGELTPGEPFPVAGNFVVTDEIELGKGGPVQKYKDNVAAIRLLKKIEAENRQATPDEQKVLARYVGWGGLKQAFPVPGATPAKGWADRVAEVRELLTDDEHAAAARSIQDAHYTSRLIVESIWSIARRLGFNGGRVSEHSMGIGNFFGLMPLDLRDASSLNGIELDSVTARIAKQLYPKANIQGPIGFQDVRMADNTFNLNVGNPPFGQQSLYLPDAKHLNGLSIHNQFFARAIDKLAPGGLHIQVVSRYLMDAQDSRAREYMAHRTRLVGAIRLPWTAFYENARTEVVTDIVILQKLPESEWGTADDSWTRTAEVPDPLGGAPMQVNAYYQQNPEMILGQMDRSGEMLHENDITVQPPKDMTLEQAISEAIDRLPVDIYQRGKSEEDVQAEEDRAYAEEGAEAGQFTLTDDGKLMQADLADDGSMRVSEITHTTQYGPKSVWGAVRVNRVKGMVQIRDAEKALLKAERQGRSKLEIDSLRQRLNEVYDAFVKEFGYLNEGANEQAFKQDPSLPMLLALEAKFDAGVSKAKAAKLGIPPRKPSAEKMPIFTQPVVERYVAPTKADTPADGLLLSISEKGGVDIPYIARLTGMQENEVVDELTKPDARLVYLNPANGQYELTEHYLSGNVKKKYQEATQAGLIEQAEALKAAFPPDVSAGDIRARMGAGWVSEQDYEDFAAHMFGQDTKATVRYLKNNGGFTTQIEPGDNNLAMVRWGTPRRPGEQLFNRILNNKDLTVRDKDSDGNTYVNVEATQAANDKAEEIRQEFENWIFKDGERRDRLVAFYNEHYNTNVEAEIDGSYLKFPGKVPDAVIKLRRHQNNSVARLIRHGKILLDHVVGAGKTFTIIASAMEQRRIGLVRKPMIVVPNHLVEQWATDFYKLYPGAKILAMRKTDFESKNRRRMLARIATGDYDAIIFSHSSFGHIGNDRDILLRHVNHQIMLMQAAIDMVRQTEGKKSRTASQYQKSLDRLKAKMQRLADAPKDKVLTFQELGVDMLYVDESHEFKNLYFTTQRQNTGGFGNPNGSKKAFDMYVKTQWLQDVNQGRGVAFATGTPISNSLTELFTLQRYLGRDELDSRGIESLDGWLSAFGVVESEYESNVTGTAYKRKDRLRRITNAPELVQLYKAFADSVTLANIEQNYRDDNNGAEFPIPRPTSHPKPRTNVVVPRSARQAEFSDALNERMKMLKRGGKDNALKILTDGRKAALDMRLIDPTAPDEPDSKANEASAKIFRIYKENDYRKGTQLVFLDLSTPIKGGTKQAQKYLKDARELLDQPNAAPFGDLRAQWSNLKGLLIEKMDSLDEDEGGTKAEGMVDKIEALLAESDEIEAAVTTADLKFSVYDDMRQKLIDMGIPAAEIAFIHDYNGDAQKLELFDAVNAGQIRVLFGSTAKMGAGTNVQRRAVALHHMDCPWRPSDIEQREGRVIRQGNEFREADPNFRVEIIAYATEATSDVFFWQTQEQKLNGINSLRNYKGEREIEEVSADAMTASEMKALASGNPLILEDVKLTEDVRKLDAGKRRHASNQMDLESRVAKYERIIAEYPAQIETLSKDVEKAQAYKRNPFEGVDRPTVVVDGKAMNASEANAYVVNVMTLAQEKAREENAPIRAKQEQIEAELEHLDLKLRNKTSDEYKALKKRWDDLEEKKAPAKWEVTMAGKKYTSREGARTAIVREAGDVDPFRFVLPDGKALVRRADADEAISGRLNSVLRAQADSADLGTYASMPVSIENASGPRTKAVVVRVGNSERTIAEYESGFGDDKKMVEVTPSRVMAAVSRAVDEIPGHVESLRRELDGATKNVESLREGLGKEWGKDEELARKRARLSVVRRLLAGEQVEDTALEEPKPVARPTYDLDRWEGEGGPERDVPGEFRFSMEAPDPVVLKPQWQGSIEGVQATDYLAYDGDEIVGNVVVHERDGVPVILYHIEALQRGNGAGTRMLADVMGRVGEDLYLQNIQPQSVEFWRKMGAEFIEGSTDGILTPSRFQEALAGRAGKTAQGVASAADEQRGKGPGREAESDSQEALFDVADDAALTDQPAYRDGEPLEELRKRVDQVIRGNLPASSFVAADRTDAAGAGARDVASLFGKRVVYFRNNVATRIRFNGVVFPSHPSTIYLDTDSVKPHMAVLGHELLHMLRREHPDLYRVLYDAVIPMLQNEAQYVAELNAKRAAGNTGNLPNRDAYLEELIADLVGDRFMERSFWERMQEKNPTLFQRIGSIILDFVDAVLSKLTGRGFNSKRYFKDIEAAREVVAAVMSSYAARTGAMLPQPGGKKGELAWSAPGEAPVFYSELANRLTDLSQRAGTAAQWAGIINNLTTKGVKRDEIEWSGVLDWLSTRGGKVSKADVLAYLEQNGVQVTETELKDEAPPTVKQKMAELEGGLREAGYSAVRDEDEGRITAVTNDKTGSTWDFDSDDTAGLPPRVAALATQLRNVQDATDEDLEDAGFMETKFGQYQLPGGTNYRELLLTLPAEKQATKGWTAKRFGESTGADYDGWDVRATLPDGRLFRSEIALDDAATEDEAIAAAQRAAGAHPMTDAPSAFRGKHWDEANVVAHVRFNERTDADGKRVLFIEEIQSDWAQQGKRDGFAGSSENYKVTQEKDGTWSAADDGGGGEGGFPTRAAAQAWADTENARDPIAVPKAPFVTKTEAWVSLALKRMIRYAAENGFDRVAWTTGVQQAERYDLSKRIGHLRWDDASTRGVAEADLSAPEGEGNLYGYDLSGNLVIDKAIRHDELEEFVGKELAERLLQSKPKQARSPASTGIRRRELSGLELRVGGEGMRTFYDTIVPGVARDVLKRLGGSSVGAVDMKTGDGRKIDRKDLADAAVGYINGDIDVDELLSGADLNGIVDAQFVEDRLDGRMDDGQARAVARQFAAEVARIAAGKTTMKQPGFDITPALRERAMGGLPMFSREGQGQTDTPEFKRWFGDSKVVDADGRPLVVYHGTTADFSTFDRSGDIGYHFGTIDQAQSRMMTQQTGRWDDSARAMPVYLNIRNPLRLDDLHMWEPRDVLIALRDAGIITAKEADADVLVDLEFVRDALARKGYDGIVYFNETEGSGDSYIAFQPEQIKSAVGNRGTFDPTDPDIRFSMDLPRKARQAVADLLSTPNTFNWWHRTIGTQYHKAQVDRDFGRVFDIGQDYLTDTSKYSMQAEAQAPGILMRLETLKDLAPRWIGGTARIAKSDANAIASPIFEGTLDKVVYADADLRARFGLNDKQIGLYREFLASVNKSLDEMAKSQMAKMVTTVGISRGLIDRLRRQDITLADFHAELVQALNLREAALKNLARGLPAGPEKEKWLAEAKQARLQVRATTDLYNRVQQLQGEGYAPLMRFGEYTVDVTDPATGDRLYFGMYESRYEINRAARALADAFPGSAIARGTLSKEQYRVFQGLTPETIELFARHSGLDDDALFQDFLRLAVNNRSALKRLIKRKEVPGFSSDVPRVLASFITSNARITSANYHAGQMQEAIDRISKEKGQVKDEAVRLWRYLTNPTEEAGRLRGFMFFHFIGASIASAAVNATQPITMTAPYLHQFASAARVAKEMTAASMAAARNAIPANMRTAYQRALDEGIVAPHEVYQLMAEARGTFSKHPGIQSTLRLWGGFFSLAEAFNRRTTFIAAYQIAVANGEADPYAFARRAVYDTQGIYNKGNRPNWARGAIGATIFTFKQFSIAYIEFLKRLPRKQMLLALFILWLAAGLEGLPFAEDLEDIVDTVGQWAGYGTNMKKWLRTHAKEFLGDRMGEFALHGVSSVLPFDISSRMGLHNLIPGTAVFKRSEIDKSRDVAEVVGPVGGIAQQIGKAVDKASRGQVGKAVEELMPKAIRDAIKGIEMYATGVYRDAKERKVMDVTTKDAVAKGIGFNPAKIAEESRRVGQNTQDMNLLKVTEAGIVDRWAIGRMQNDPNMVASARRDLVIWNAKNPEMKIRVSSDQIRKRIREMQTSREERTIKRAPPEIRKSVAEDMRAR